MAYAGSRSRTASNAATSDRVADAGGSGVAGEDASSRDEGISAQGGWRAAGLGAAIRAARESLGLSWYAVAQRAGLPNQGTVELVPMEA
jgi:hypothetical protein